MSEFKEQIERAARQQRIFMGILLVTLSAVALFLAVFVFLLKTTVVDVKPVDAGQTAQVSVSTGVAFYVGNTVFSLSRYPAITVSADGFEVARRVISLEEEGNLIAIEMVEKPAIFKLTIGNIEELVKWRVNGEDFPTGTEFEHSFLAGKYQIEANHPFWLPSVQTYDVKRGEVVETVLNLQPIQGTLNLDVEPEGATLTLDGKSYQAFPVTVNVAGGDYQVSVSKSGYQTIEETLRVTNDNTEVKRGYRLLKTPATLQVELSPKGGELTLNGREIPAFKAVTVSPGQKYFLNYRKEGYGQFETEFRLKPGETRREKISLKLQIGEVQLTSVPTADVMIGGKPYGKTPLTLRLPAYQQGVKFVRDGYEPELRQVTPTPSRTKKVHVSLKTEKEAKLARAKPTYKNAAGQVMKLFKPDNIRLGAPRDQRGQRANEFLRDVVLKRHFYVSETEVTVQQYSAFKPQQGNPNLPVTNVRWEDAAAFCNWLSIKEGFGPVYRLEKGKYRGFNASADGYRLPTEAEWEWLARKAGRARQTVFHWGDYAVVPKDAGNVADESARGKARFYIPNYTDRYADLAPVKSYPAESSGLYDLFGNVSEWVHDYYSLVPPRKGETWTDPMGDTSGYQHMTKGSNYLSGNLTEIRPAYRGPTEEPAKTIGFRVARYLYAGEE